MFRYTVGCSFSNAAVAAGIDEQWVSWLKNGHIQDVIDGGADGGEVVAMDCDDGRQYEVRYFFPDRATFENYEKHHAPRLREDRLEKFPLDQGLSYHRTMGQVAFEIR